MYSLSFNPAQVQRAGPTVYHTSVWTLPEKAADVSGRSLTRQVDCRLMEDIVWFRYAMRTTAYTHARKSSPLASRAVESTWLASNLCAWNGDRPARTRVDDQGKLLGLDARLNLPGFFVNILSCSPKLGYSATAQSMI